MHHAAASSAREKKPPLPLGHDTHRHGCCEASGIGRRGQVARRRCANPLGSTHAGEGAGDGAMALPSSLALARCRRGAEREKREKREWARVTGEATQRWF